MLVWTRLCSIWKRRYIWNPAFAIQTVFNFCFKLVRSTCKVLNCLQIATNVNVPLFYIFYYYLKYSCIRDTWFKKYRRLLRLVFCYWYCFALFIKKLKELVWTLLYSMRKRRYLQNLIFTTQNAVNVCWSL